MRNAAVMANANLRKRPFPAEYFDDDAEDFVDAPGAGASFDEPPATRSSKRARTGTGTGTGTPMSSSVPPTNTRSARATRNSRRNGADEGWQQVPDEWLHSDSAAEDNDDLGSNDDADADADADEDGDAVFEAEPKAQASSSKVTRGLNRKRVVSPSSSPVPVSDPVIPSNAASKIFGDDDDSDLTDLSDVDDDATDKNVNADAKQNAAKDGGNDDAESKEAAEEDDEAGTDDNDDEDVDEGPEDDDDEEIIDEEYSIRVAFSQPKEWIEWETVSVLSVSLLYCDLVSVYFMQVCVTLEEWEEFPQQFEGSTNVKERSLRKSLIPIAEAVIEVMQVHS